MDSATIAAQIADTDSKRVNSTDALNEAYKQFGIPEIRQNVAGMRTTLANTQNALKAVDPSVTGRTQGSLVTEAQRQRQVANERAPIAGQLQEQGQLLNDNERTLSDNLGQATTLATNRVNDWQTGRQALQSRYDMTYKSEQDAKQAEAQRQAAAQAQANQDREYQLSVQASNRAGTPKSASPADTKLAVAQHVAQGLSGSRGRDGYVSNETWSAALNDAVSAGFTTREFFQKYSQFVNPKYKTSYAGWANR